MNQPVMTDPRLSHAKMCPVPLGLLMQALDRTREGTRVLRVEGWPTAEDEAQIIGISLINLPNGPNLMFVLYSPKFPIVLQDPPIVGLAWEWRDLPDAFEWDDLISAAPATEPEA